MNIFKRNTCVYPYEYPPIKQQIMGIDTLNILVIARRDVVKQSLQE